MTDGHWNRLLPTWSALDVGGSQFAGGSVFYFFLSLSFNFIIFQAGSRLESEFQCQAALR